MDTINRIIEKIRQAEFYESIWQAIAESRYTGNEIDVIKSVIPSSEESTKAWNRYSGMLYEILETFGESHQEEFKYVIKQLPAGYIRSNCRSIYRRKYGEK